MSTPMNMAKRILPCKTPNNTPVEDFASALRAALKTAPSTQQQNPPLQTREKK